MQVDKVITHIDISDDDMMITLEDGSKLHFYHYQDCCESVRIYDFKGDPHNLVGKKLVMIEEDVSDELPDDVDLNPYESFTWSEFKLITNKETVISRWIGESNGYYGERVTLEQIK